MSDFDRPPSAASLKKSRQKMIALPVLLLGVSIAAFWWNTRTYHLAAVQDGILYRDGNRNMTEFGHALRKENINTVVSLIDDSELNDPAKPQFKQEAKFLAQNGYRQKRIPVKLGGWPTSDALEQFLAIVSDPTNCPVLVHCAQGVRRTGMFVAAYQLSVLGYDKDKAKAAIQTFGHSDRIADDIRKFVDDYNPTTMTLATTRPTTGNE